MLIEIFGKDIHTEEDFHKQFNNYVGYHWYGHTLDAMWDVLTGMLERPAHLVWYNSEISKERLGKTYEMIIDMFKKTAQHDEELCNRRPQFFAPDEKFTYELK